jgi:hypothetical protein
MLTVRTCPSERSRSTMLESRVTSALLAMLASLVLARLGHAGITDTVSVAVGWYRWDAGKVQVSGPKPSSVARR